MKSDLISIVSHELRNPLSTSKEGLALLLDNAVGDISEKQEWMLKIIDNNIDRLLRIIDDLLDISKIETGKTRFRRELTDLNRLVEHI